MASAVAAAGALAASHVPVADASTIVFHYYPVNLLNIVGNTVADSPIPTDRTVCYSYGLGTAALSQPISWNVQSFTGLGVPSPNSTYQAGVNNGWYGSSACQVTGTSMGFQVHKDSGQNPSPPGWIYGTQLAHNFSSWTRRPWSDSYGSGARMRLQTNYAIQARDGTYTAGLVQYGQVFVSLVDLAHSKSIWFTISMWDSRGVQPESVQPDTGGTTNFNVVTHFANGLRYASPHPNSQNSAGNSSCGCLWYSAYVSRTNLLNAVNDINARFGQNYSTNPNDYAINFVGAGTEMYSPPGTTGWIGSRIWDVMALTEY